MGPRVVLDGILNELKSRQSEIVERQMIGAAHAVWSKRRHAHALEGRHPRFKYGSDILVALHIHASNQPGAVVEIEIGRQFRVPGFRLRDWTVEKIFVNKRART